MKNNVKDFLEYKHLYGMPSEWNENISEMFYDIAKILVKHNTVSKDESIAVLKLIAEYSSNNTPEEILKIEN